MDLSLSLFLKTSVDTLDECLRIEFIHVLVGSALGDCFEFLPLLLHQLPPLFHGIRLVLLGVPVFVIDRVLGLLIHVFNQFLAKRKALVYCICCYLGEGLRRRFYLGLRSTEWKLFRFFWFRYFLYGVREYFFFLMRSDFLILVQRIVFTVGKMLLKLIFVEEDMHIVMLTNKNGKFLHFSFLSVRTLC